jgi:hypothetical protein
VILPSEVRARGERDGLAELEVADALQVFGELAGQRRRRGDRARGAALGRALQGLDGADPEAELADIDALGAEALGDRGGEERKLVRPHARRDLDDEDPPLEKERLGPVRDAGPHGVAPDAPGDGWAIRGEAVFACAIQHGVEGLGAPQSRRRAGM